MVLSHKLVFHIPQKKWQDGCLEPISDDISVNLIKDLNKAGCDSMYLQKVTGCFKGRSYPELLITLFCLCDTDAKIAEGIFEEWVHQYGEALEQEEWAYEKDGKMIIFK